MVPPEISSASRLVGEYLQTHGWPYDIEISAAEALTIQDKKLRKNLRKQEPGEEVVMPALACVIAGLLLLSEE